MAHIRLETNDLGHILEFDGTQEEVTTLLAMAILGSERLKNLILDALEAQEYLKERGCKATPTESVLMNIDNKQTVN